MNVLVTGARGHVGRLLVRYLQSEGDYVVCSDDDLTKPPVFCANSLDVIYHLAGPKPHSHDRGTALAMIDQVLWTAECSRFKCRVIVVGSSKQYGQMGTSPTAEDTPVNAATLTPYGADKLAAEVAALDFARRSKKVEVIAARPFDHWAPWVPDRFAVGAWTKQLVEGLARRDKPLRVRIGNIKGLVRDILPAIDVCRAYRTIALKGTPGEVYNVCSGEEIRLSEVLDMLRRPDFDAVVDSALDRPVNQYELGDNSKLRVLGWEPQPAPTHYYRIVGLVRAIYEWRFMEQFGRLP